MYVDSFHQQVFYRKSVYAFEQNIIERQERRRARKKEKIDSILTEIHASSIHSLYAEDRFQALLTHGQVFVCFNRLDLPVTRQKTAKPIYRRHSCIDHSQQREYPNHASVLIVAVSLCIIQRSDGFDEHISSHLARKAGLRGKRSTEETQSEMLE